MIPSDKIKAAVSKRVANAWQSPNWFRDSFPEQTAFIKDPAKMKAAHCTRRAGKSYGCGLYLCKEAYENPGVSVLYLALTRGTAGRIMWKDILKDINRKFNLGAKFNDQELKMTFPNGSVIYLEGADAKQDAMDKLLGQKFKLVVVDEASKFRVDVERLLFDVLKPTLTDYDGTLAMIGTASNIVGSYFARATKGHIPGWKVHRWSAVNNPHIRENFLAEIKRLKESNPRVEEEAWFRQNYLGEWVVDTKALVYRYEEPKVRLDKIPDIPLHYCIGATLSFSGRSAFSVIAYSEKSRDAYVVETLTYEDNSIYRAIETMQSLYAVYSPTYMVCADASRKLVEELRSRFAVPVHEAPEKDKPALIRLFATELSQGHVKVLEGSNKDLLNEWDSIILDTRTTRAILREHPVCPNQLATATLYAWQKCFNYAYKPTKVSDDPMDAHWASMREDIENGGPQDDFQEFYGIPET